MGEVVHVDFHHQRVLEGESPLRGLVERAADALADEELGRLLDGVGPTTLLEACDVCGHLVDQDAEACHHCG